MEKKEFTDSLDYYIEFLLFDREEIFENEMVAGFHLRREEIDEGMSVFRINKKKHHS